MQALIIAIAGVAAACIFSLGASVLMTKSSNRSPVFNIAVGGGVALAIALLLYLLVLVIERVAFA